MWIGDLTSFGSEKPDLSYIAPVDNTLQTFRHFQNNLVLHCISVVFFLHCRHVEFLSPPEARHGSTIISDYSGGRAGAWPDQLVAMKNWLGTGNGETIGVNTGCRLIMIISESLML